MKSALFVLGVVALAYVLGWNRTRTPDDQLGVLTAVSRAIDALPSPASRSPSWMVDGDALATSTDPHTIQAPEPGMYASSWFGSNNDRARVIGTDPVNGLIIFTITRPAGERGGSRFPTFNEVKRLYADPDQDVATLARADFEFQGGLMYVSNFEVLHTSRFINPNYAVLDPDDPKNEAHAWEGITRFQVDSDGSLTVMDFDQTFAGTIARQYVRLEQP
jgi:hypothetical protein